MATTLYDFVSVKLLLGDENPEIRRLKLPLKDLTPSTLPSKLTSFLSIPATKNVSFERWSDSAAAYVALDPSNQAVYKQLYRAAKAKAKLRIKVVVTDKEEPVPVQVTNLSEEREIPIIKAPSPMSSQTAFSIPVTSPRKVVQLPETIKATHPPAIPSPLKPWTGHLTSFTVQCNNCTETIPDAHFHCDICENNDFDLCVKCVDDGFHCNVPGHYLIKRSVVNGKLINSTTYKVPKKAAKEEKVVPTLIRPEAKESVHIEATRTCNSCVSSYPESKFITCLDCDDYDLCQPCFREEKHGHHPAHSFKSVDGTTVLPYEVTRRLNSGRGLRHFATCDGCDQNIVGVRHKCLNCPDWDFCTTCSLSARHIHPGHRFVPLYDHIGLGDTHKPLHNFVRCDGPLCKNKQTYIRGDRYKCAVCPDTDFCSSCEALPTNNHCRTHPLIKLRTPVRNVSVTTFGEDNNGEIMSTMGDRPPQKASKSTETVSTKSMNAATQVQTIAEIKPALPKVEPIVTSPKADAVEIAAQPVSPMFRQPQLHAHFVSDSLVDGSKVQPDTLYTQTWTLRNPGPSPWPAGCNVRYTGGENMLNISPDRPNSTKDIEAAVSSNTCDYMLNPQQEVQFTITIKTPKVLGRAVSYWRLKTPQGIPFGHKLWCDVDVIAPEPLSVKPTKSETVKGEVVEKETVKDKVEEVKADQELPEQDSNLEGSKMIFPTLDKESPESSIMPTAENSDEGVDFVDDLEHLELSDPDSDDAFLTDEEYEMLDTESIIEEATNGKK